MSSWVHQVGSAGLEPEPTRQEAATSDRHQRAGSRPTRVCGAGPRTLEVGDCGRLDNRHDERRMDPGRVLSTPPPPPSSEDGPDATLRPAWDSIGSSAGTGKATPASTTGPDGRFRDLPFALAQDLTAINVTPNRSSSGKPRPALLERTPRDQKKDAYHSWKPGAQESHPAS